jgi:pseudouridine-5'-phosphate glycosidase
MSIKQPLPLITSARVRVAVISRRPVVALETTLLTHGFAQPEGLEVARELEAAIRDEDAEPATIGVLDGRIHVGLDEPSLARLASTPGVVKLNPGNLAACVAQGGTGSTTVAATLMVAHQAGIPVFATGGIGGVHRGSLDTNDVSADLTALARFPVAVVCSGAKAILDLPRTLEALETLCVPVFGVGTDRFPAFYRRDSGLPVDARFDDVDELASAVRLHTSLGGGTGIIVANPVPVAAELDEATYNRALRDALEAAARAGIRGRAVTPFLLEKMRLETEGASVFSNRALLIDNARVAARLAKALTRLSVPV